MGTWNTKIDSNDTFLDIYQAFFNAYNQGKDPMEISGQIQHDYAEMFNDQDDKNNCLFGLALAQWEVKSLDPKIFQQVQELIETGNDLEIWRELGADEKTIRQRKVALNKFLIKLSTEREKPKRRARSKDDFSYNELINIVAPDEKKTFSAVESFNNKVYIHTGSGISWATGGGSIFYFSGQGKYISAEWRDSQTLEITHDKDIIFTMKEESFFYSGDQGVVIYIPIETSQDSKI
ncbi:MAG TPA: hypothetical protein VFE32_19190 [Puia sp.]|jgi:hypothetical protein|nr:hypothetical protein [Puia sp.]